MKNLVRVVALAAAVALPAVVSAQDNQFKVGSRVLNVGLLLGGTSYTYGSGGIGLGAGFEVGVAEIAGQVRLGVGGQLGYQRDDDGLFGSNFSVSSTTITAFVNGHYQIKQVPKLDVYAGPVLGFSRQTLDYDDLCTVSAFYDCDDSSTDPAVGVQVGARYEFAPRLMGSLQISGGSRLPWVNVGIAFKL